MRQIADFHIHSGYSRACSSELTLPNIENTCRSKGIDIIATGDFTFPDWFEAIRENLTPDFLSPNEEGRLYVLKTAGDDKVKFILSTELSLIYKTRDKARRIHLVVHAPSIEAVTELIGYLDKNFNIRSDGRPILGMSAPDLVKLCLSIHPKFMVYPAHIWTPWYAVFGSKSGFNTMEECFEDQIEHIYAYETGLSSDPEMNWRVSALDRLTLLSNSDAHSLPNIAREANVFELDEVSYGSLYDAIRHKDSDKLKYTIEFYPEEGMYHYDGHRECGVRFEPEETKRHKGICPQCRKPLTVGVVNRVDKLSDRPAGFRPKGVPGFKKLVELDKIIAEALGLKSRTAQKVQVEYNNLIKQAGTEMNALLDEPLENLSGMTLPIIAEGIRRVREGSLIVEPGFDGQYGTVRIFSDDERGKEAQQTLF